MSKCIWAENASAGIIREATMCTATWAMGISMGQKLKLDLGLPIRRAVVVWSWEPTQQISNY